MDKLMELIERLEKATEGSAELDLEIARWRGVTVMLHDEISDKNVESTYWRYTTSLDAATSLEPPGCTAFESGDTIGGAWARCVVTDENLETHEHTAHHPKEPIARVIAALKARRS